MKTIAFLIAALLPLVLSTPVIAETAPTHDHGVQLTLDNGKKWTADNHTAASVAAMKPTVEKVSSTSPRPSLDQMQAAGTTLVEQLQTLIRGCTMTGPAHEQLHAWIAALAPQIEKLKNAARPEDGYAAIESISGLLRTFEEHFQAGS